VTNFAMHADGGEVAEEHRKSVSLSGRKTAHVHKAPLHSTVAAWLDARIPRQGVAPG